MMTPRNTTSFGDHNSGVQIAENTGHVTVNLDSKTEQAANNKCLSALSVTNPRDDKSRIEKLKGDLLGDAYKWVFENPDYQRWRYEEGSHCLWVRGDPGKGKTMLLCGIIDNLIEHPITPATTIVYFFCQAADDRLNHATDVIRGLMFMLIQEHPQLITHVRKEYDKQEDVFQGQNTWEVLLRIWKAMFQDPILQAVCVIIDALDECTTDLEGLLEFMIENLSSNTSVKWLVSSRSEEWIVNDFEIKRRDAELAFELLSLELNVEFVSAAVNSFIHDRLQKLSKLKSVSEKDLSTVFQHLKSNANGTFLWVALVCEELSNPRLSNRHIIRQMHEFPAGLDKLYKRMLSQILADDNFDSELCKSILAIATTVYRPITLEELSVYIDLDEYTKISDLPEIIRRCASFLVLQKSTIFLVHQSAKDFLARQAIQHIFPFGPKKVHYDIFSKSMQSMFRLRRDIYGLVHPGHDVEQVIAPDPDPLALVKYSCVYWMDHLEACFHLVCADFPADLAHRGHIDVFLSKQYLYWLETISLLKSVSKGTQAMLRLRDLIESEPQNEKLIDRAKDALRFLLYHQTAIRNWPLQVYASALIFSPVHSETRIQYYAQQPKWVTQNPATEYQWSPCLYTLETHTSDVSSVYFSNDSKFLLSGSYDGTVRIWNTNSGECLTTLKKNSSVSSVTPFQESKFIIFAPVHEYFSQGEEYPDSLIEVCDENNNCTSRMIDRNAGLCCVAVWDSRFIVTGCQKRKIKIWDTEIGECVHTLDGHRSTVSAVSVSQELGILASGSHDREIRIWDLHSRECIQTLTEHERSVKSVVFSPDSLLLASGSSDQSVKLWSTDDWRCIITLGHDVTRHWETEWRTLAQSLVFSHDSKVLATGSELGDIHIWDTGNGQLLQTCNGHQRAILSVKFSHDSSLLASASSDHTVRIWDATNRQPARDFDIHHGAAMPYFSHNTKLIATVQENEPFDIKIWDAQDGKFLQSINDCNGGLFHDLAFSCDLKRLAIGSGDKKARIWDINTGQCVGISKSYTAHSGDLEDFLSNNPDLQLDSDPIALSSYFLRGPKFSENRAYYNSEGLGMSQDGAFITWDNERLLFVPLEYRPNTIGMVDGGIIVGSKLYISCASGRVLLFDFDFDAISRLVA